MTTNPRGSANVPYGLYLLFNILAYVCYARSYFGPLVELGPIVPILLYMLGLLGSTLLHELGHALAARLVGWRVIVFSVGWLAWHTVHRRLIFTRRAKFHDAHGWVMAVPARPEVATPTRDAVFAAGGGALNFLALVALLAIGRLTPDDAAWGNVLLSQLALAAGLQQAGVLAATLIPQDRRFPNDGAKIREGWELRRRGEALDAAGWLAGLLDLAIRVRDVPGWMIERSQAQHAESEDHRKFHAMLATARVLDRMPADLGEARSLLAAYRAAHGPDDWLLACEAYVAAVYARDLDLATARIGEIGTPSALPQMEFAARAAACMLAGDRGAGRRWLDAMMAAIRAHSPYPDLTFRDIHHQIERIVPLSPLPSDLPIDRASS